MGEAVFEEPVLVAECLGAVGAFVDAVACLLLVSLEGFRLGKMAAAFFADDLRHGIVQRHVMLAGLQTGEHTLAQVALVEFALKVSIGQVVLQRFVRGKRHEADATVRPVRLAQAMRAQVQTVVVDLREALAAFGTAVRARSRVEVHVVLELKVRGEPQATHSADVVARISHLCREDKGQLRCEIVTFLSEFHDNKNENFAISAKSAIHRQRLVTVPLTTTEGEHLLSSSVFTSVRNLQKASGFGLFQFYEQGIGTEPWCFK